jgi:ribonuclease HI
MIPINFENWSEDIIICYSDGSANWKNKCGGYSILIVEKGEQLKTHFNEYPTTIGRMELKGVITILKLLNINEKAVIYCDSEYVTNCINKKWLKDWKQFNFVGKKNEDLLKQYFELFYKFPRGNIKIKHIRGHVGYEGNEICDELAKKGYYEAKKALRR